MYMYRVFPLFLYIQLCTCNLIFVHIWTMTLTIIILLCITIIVDNRVSQCLIMSIAIIHLWLHIMSDFIMKHTITLNYYREHYTHVHQYFFLSWRNVSCFGFCETKYFHFGTQFLPNCSDQNALTRINLFVHASFPPYTPSNAQTLLHNDCLIK